MSRWFRFYDDVINDPKVLKLPENVRWSWVAVLCIASKGGGNLPSLEDTAFLLRATRNKTEAILSTLVKAGLLDQIGEQYSPHNWGGRQFKSEETPSRGKDSYVYFIGTAWGDTLKIGFSKNPWARLGDLQTSHHEKLEVLAAFRCKAHSEVALHDLLAAHRKQGEWFDLPTKIYVAAHNAAERKNSYEELVAEITTLLRSTTTETEQIQNQKDPEANASGADAPIDHRKRLFNEGLSKLAAMTGKGPDACRSFVGKCLKAASDDAVTVLGLIEEAERNQVIDPSAWIVARLKPLEIGSGKPKSAIIQAADDLCRKIASFDGPTRSPDELRSREGPPPLKMLSHGGGK